MISLLALGRSDRSYLLSGLFVLAGLLLLAGWLAVKVFGQSFRSHDYYAFLTDVTGLRIGTPVMVAGYKIGLVKEIGHRGFAPGDDNGPAPGDRTGCEMLGDEAGPGAGQRYFRLRLEIDQAWRLTTGTKVSLESPNLLGQPIIDLRPGSGSPLCAGSAIRYEARPVAPAPDVAALTQRADQVLTTVEDILQEVRNEQLPKRAADLLAEMRNTVARLDSAAKGLNDFVTDPRLRAATAEAERAAGQLKTVLEEARQLAHEARTAVPAFVGAVNELRPPLGSAAANLDYAARLTATRLPGVLSDLERSTQDLSGLVADLRSNPPAALRGRAEETPTWGGAGRH